MGLLAIIGGSGFKSLPGLQQLDARQLETPYGDTSAPVTRGRLGEAEVLFIPRHGPSHHLPPHRINYRANLWALRESGADRVIGLAAVGGITPAFGPCVISVPDQVIDYTHGREHTLYDGTTGEVEHIDLTAPYSDALRQALIDVCSECGQSIVPHGCYGATQGPRLETAAEIRRCERDGCDMVGMTGMPEASLARELRLCYASLAFVVNWAAGKSGSIITMKEIEENLDLCAERVMAVLTAAAQSC
ncbi:S-methyl-5'-thioinosine phosphorylase [Thiorhodococcus mannitoliphagus]|uniref:Probable S-methyl-5'-thioinosine phosphorylase n=1 Tax=Thiorhodococcus mannitoliphagus TaxID=329406 RepID=A0A6P1DQY9_9GAMM|nr:S-methyl-5'-thioinosine phosphorylase [Thiorhodococcus mannitoliphagus]NEX19573.1 S-methyl-5'-thioinosine phosphorylase [Thiorhodococcus mannitoliphagus]